MEEDQIPPQMIRCSYDRLNETGAYLIENGIVMYVWLGRQVNPTFVQSLFGLQTASHIQAEKVNRLFLILSSLKIACL